MLLLFVHWKFPATCSFLVRSIFLPRAAPPLAVVSCHFPTPVSGNLPQISHSPLVLAPSVAMSLIHPFAVTWSSYPPSLFPGKVTAMTVPFTLGTEQVIAKFLVSSKNPAKEPRLRAGVKVPSWRGRGESRNITHSSHFCCWSYSISR